MVPTETSKNVPGFKDLVSCLQYNANVMQRFGLIPTMAVVLASSSLRIQVGRDTNRVCGGASRNLAFLNSGNGSIREKQALALLRLLLHLRYSLFEMRLHCINILFQQDSVVANCRSRCCRENRIASFGRNQDELNTQGLEQGPRLKTEDLREYTLRELLEAREVCSKGVRSTVCLVVVKVRYLQTLKDFCGFLTFTAVFNVLMRMVQLFGV